MTTGTGAAAPRTSDEVLPSARTLGKGLAALRVFMGLVLLLNGLAKLFDVAQVRLGPYVANLIDRDAARFILRYEVFENPAGGGPARVCRACARSPTWCSRTGRSSAGPSP